MTTILKLTAVALVALSLSACGSRTSDRAISGAGIGAAAGAAVGWVTGVGPGVGAAVGAGVGAAAAALTDENDIDLGRPWWRSRN